MSAIKIENKTKDDIIIILDGEEARLADDEQAIFSDTQKGEHTLIVKRVRIPKVTLDTHAAKGPDITKMTDSNPVSHIQLESEISFEVISSKAVISIVQNVEVVDTLHEDALFAGYRADASGAKNLTYKDRFANEKVKNDYKKQQLKGAFLPVGLIGIIVTLAGIVCLLCNLSGYDLKLMGNPVSTPQLILVLVGGITILVFFIFNIKKIKNRIKALS